MLAHLGALGRHVGPLGRHLVPLSRHLIANMSEKCHHGGSIVQDRTEDASDISSEPPKSAKKNKENTLF